MSNEEEDKLLKRVCFGGAILLVLFMMLGAKIASNAPEPTVLPGVCIYSVAVNQLINNVNIAWTSQPCQDLDINDEDDFALMQHSWFQAVCPVWSVGTWPNLYLPVVDYHTSCNLNIEDLQHRAVIDHAIIENGR